MIDTDEMMAERKRKKKERRIFVVFALSAFAINEDYLSKTLDKNIYQNICRFHSRKKNCDNAISCQRKKIKMQSDKLIVHTCLTG